MAKLVANLGYFVDYDQWIEAGSVSTGGDFWGSTSTQQAFNAR